MSTDNQQPDAFLQWLDDYISENKRVSGNPRVQAATYNDLVMCGKLLLEIREKYFSLGQREPLQQAGLIAKLKEYIAFLGGQFDETFTLAHLHHYRPSQESIDKGKRLREEIAALQSSIPEQPLLSVQQEPKEMSEEESIEALTLIMRECDKQFETSGGGTKHYVRDLLLPALAEKGINLMKQLHDIDYPIDHVLLLNQPSPSPLLDRVGEEESESGSIMIGDGWEYERWASRQSKPIVGFYCHDKDHGICDEKCISQCEDCGAEPLLLGQAKKEKVRQQPFEQFPELVTFIQNMASTGVVPSGSNWTAFLYHLNKVCASRSTDAERIRHLQEELTFHKDGFNEGVRRAIELEERIAELEKERDDYRIFIRNAHLMFNGELHEQAGYLLYTKYLNNLSHE